VFGFSSGGSPHTGHIGNVVGFRSVFLFLWGFLAGEIFGGGGGGGFWGFGVVLGVGCVF